MPIEQDVFLRESDQAPQAQQVPKGLTDKFGSLRRGRVAILNDRKTITANGATATFSYQIPSVEIAYIIEITYDIVNSRVLPVAIGANQIDPAQILVEQFSFQRAGTTESADIVLAGAPTVAEVAGNGKLPRLLTRIIELNPHQAMEIILKNNGTINADVSLTFWLETSGR